MSSARLPIVQFEIGSMSNFIYLVLDWNLKQAAIVDPQKDLTHPSKFLKDEGFELISILLTHSHHDHTAGVIPLLTMLPHLEIRVGAEDLYRLPDTVKGAPGLRILKDGEIFKVGDLPILAFHTPGHSPGAFMYFIEPSAAVKQPQLLTGDTVFIRDCGRTDFDNGSNEQMFASLQKVKALPPETVMWVGHHYAPECVTTLKDELERSPPFQCRSVEELAALP